MQQDEIAQRERFNESTPVGGSPTREERLAKYQEEFSSIYRNRVGTAVQSPPNGYNASPERRQNATYRNDAFSPVRKQAAAEPDYNTHYNYEPGVAKKLDFYGAPGGGGNTTDDFSDDADGEYERIVSRGKNSRGMASNSQINGNRGTGAITAANAYYEPVSTLGYTPDRRGRH